jgi:uncharacterized RDD family membrane protein YckC
MDVIILDEQQDEARPMGVKYASFWRRVGAHLLDQLFLSVANAIFVYATKAYFEVYMLTIFSAFVAIIYKIYMEKEYGQTIGKILANIKVVDEEFKPLRFEQVIKRNYYVFVSAAATLLLVFNVFGLQSLRPNAVSYTDTMFANAVHPLYLILVLIYIIDCLAITSNDTKMTLHDMFGKTVVIENHHSNSK